MSARVQYAPYGWCDSCAEGGDVGVSTPEAEAWVEEHNRLNHEEDGAE